MKVISEMRLDDFPYHVIVSGTEEEIAAYAALCRLEVDPTGLEISDGGIITASLLNPIHLFGQQIVKKALEELSKSLVVRIFGKSYGSNQSTLPVADRMATDRRDES